jgi:hypothetical protein
MKAPSVASPFETRADGALLRMRVYRLDWLCSSHCLYFFPYDTPIPARTSAWMPYGAIG